MPRRAFFRPGLLLAGLAAFGTACPVGRPERGCPRKVRPDRELFYLAGTGCLESLGAEFRDRDFRGAVWVGMDLRPVSFHHCDLRGADLADAALAGTAFWGCDLTGARLEGANFQGARYDRFTRWPAGFRADEHGARLETE